MIFNFHSKTNILLAQATRVVLVVVCCAVLFGNSLAPCILNLQLGIVSESMPAEEAPVEEVPVESQVPLEPVELDDFIRHRPCQLHGRQTSATYRQVAFHIPGSGCALKRQQYRAQANGLPNRNGCGAALRC